MKKYSLIFLAVLLAMTAMAHVGNHPSIHDVVAAIKLRLKKTLPPEELAKLDVPRLLTLMTEEERHVLATEHISFRVNVPVVVSVARDIRLADEPYWLKDYGFTQTDLQAQVDDKLFDVWQKEFPAGVVGLGVNSLAGGRMHYFVTMRPKNAEDKLEVTEIYPGFHFLTTAKKGAKPHLDEGDTIDVLPQQLDGQTLLTTLDMRCDVAKLVGIFLVTDYPASEIPDHVVLTWSEDPRNTQTIQWRTSLKTTKGLVAYQKKQAFEDGKPLQQVPAVTKLLETPDILNDPSVFRHTAILRDLEPDTTYVYSVGDGNEARWTAMAEFTTAPLQSKPFSFLYMGDAQNGLDTWGKLAHKAFAARPNAAFFVMAGDLVNRGAERYDWDHFFQSAEGIYNRCPIIPAIGNHEVQGGYPGLYLEMFDLPRNGPALLEPERAYSFEYSNACFIVLDSNVFPLLQMEWLEKQLANTKATWKFLIYHHPAFSAREGRDNFFVRELWTPIFDKYHVDVALQGHDHSYMRTYPVKAKKKVSSPQEGTYYVVSVSGTKMYPQDPNALAEVGFTNIATYQTLDIEINGNRLTYRAYDLEGKLRDEFVIEK